MENPPGQWVELVSPFFLADSRIWVRFGDSVIVVALNPNPETCVCLLLLSLRVQIQYINWCIIFEALKNVKHDIKKI